MRRRAWNPADHPRDPDGRFRNGWAGAVSGRLPAPAAAVETESVPFKRPVWTVKLRDVVHDGDGWWRVRSISQEGDKYTLGLIRHSGEQAERKYTGRDRLQLGNPKDLFEQTKDWGRQAPTGADAKEMGRFRRDATVRTFRRLTDREKRLRENTQLLDNARRMLADANSYWRKRGERAGYGGDELEQFVTRNVPASYRDRVEVLELSRSKIPAEDDPRANHRSDVVEMLVKPDPKRPLALYGDMIKLGGGRAPLIQARTLAKIPVEFHYPVAKYMAGGWGEKPGGMYLVPRSSAEVWDLSPFDEGPRGWGEDASWSDVDGVYDDNVRTLVAGWGPTLTHKRVEETAGHEFGHALDAALGRPSTREDWKGIHDGILGKKQKGFNPYFEQEGHAGREEFWAEAFGAWGLTRQRIAEGGDSHSEDLHIHHLSRALQIDSEAAKTILYYFDALQAHLQKRLQEEVGQ